MSCRSPSAGLVSRRLCRTLASTLFWTMVSRRSDRTALCVKSPMTRRGVRSVYTLTITLSGTTRLLLSTITLSRAYMGSGRGVTVRSLDICWPFVCRIANCLHRGRLFRPSRFGRVSKAQFFVLRALLRLSFTPAYERLWRRMGCRRWSGLNLGKGGSCGRC